MSTDAVASHRGSIPPSCRSTGAAGGAATGSGYGPLFLDYVLGITKAYATRVGAGPFPTELFDDIGAHLASVGREKGATTGRDRRCGWFDAVANSIGHRAIPYFLIHDPFSDFVYRASPKYLL